MRKPYPGKRFLSIPCNFRYRHPGCRYLIILGFRYTQSHDHPAHGSGYPLVLRSSADLLPRLTRKLTPLVLLFAITGSATAAEDKTSDPVLVQAMETELHRAMTDLGNTPATPGKEAPQKPYFVSYSVSDAENVLINAQYGAITNSADRHSRMADVQVRIGSPAQDNTHDTHRTSALTTYPLPLADDRMAIERTLWYATNKGYGKALDALEKVKTEQQVRAKEEDSSADFSNEKPAEEVLPAASPLSIDRAAWESRLREISAIFRRYPKIYYDMVSLQASHETDTVCFQRGCEGAVAQPGCAAGHRCAYTRCRRHGPLPRRDLRGGRRRQPAPAERGAREDRSAGKEPRPAARGAHHGALQRTGDSLRPRRGWLLP